ncbi:MAG: GNAT family N-acetyltransferase [Clostridium sp.]|nr:GNAT family N-acetyltransferase [Clostridium sp.]MCM1172570.1 GNAT family N-acetyltransferase [Clostridium sp.]MCM1208398.1 GNAT family N-acetyltransferase [Ruminococcus sp.]
MPMIVDNAQITDIDELTELRLAYLEEDNGTLSEDDREKIRMELPGYFKRHLNKSIFCYLAKEGGQIVACAFLLLVEKPMSPLFINGRTGTVLNVYTKPKYRHKGYGKMVMEKLLSDAAEKDLCVVELKSTEEGYSLYKSVGFTDDVSKYHLMKWHHQ